MVCEYHLGQLAENERALRQGKLSRGEAALEDRTIGNEILRCCP